MKYYLITIAIAILIGCQAPAPSTIAQNIEPGAMQMEQYLPLLNDKRIGVVVNPTSQVGEKHLLDTLLALELEVVKIFTPEHGLRGDKSAGEIIQDGIDQTSGLPVVSLYGSNKKPSPASMEGLDVMIFDMQDVGTRFYTYISTMHYVMEACADAGVELVILDRPNPNGHYVAGPVREEGFESFVGMHPTPIVHGMTVGELAQMIVGEGWLDTDSPLTMKIIPVKNWDHATPYSLPVKPSPNLPNDQAIGLYPSLCLFEGTVVSIGRGTELPFQIIGHPAYSEKQFSFTPTPNPGAKNPPLKGETCYGLDLSSLDPIPNFTLSYLINFYNDMKDDGAFFNNYFNTLAGNASLQEQIKAGLNEAEIMASWEADINDFKEKRRQYLLYKDFE